MRGIAESRRTSPRFRYSAHSASAFWCVLEPRLLRRLRGRRQESVEPEVDRRLAVMIAPVIGSDHHCAGAGERHAEDGHVLAEVGVGQLGDRVVAELEGLLEPRDQGLLSARGGQLRSLRRLHAADLTAERVVAAAEVQNDVGEAHLRRRRLEEILVGRHDLSGGDQVLSGARRLIPKGVCRRRLRRREGWEDQKAEDSERGAHGSLFYRRGEGTYHESSGASLFRERPVGWDMPTRSSSTESKLARLRREVATAPRQRPTRSVKARRARGREFALRALWLIAILTLPFIIFVRAAVYFSAVTGAWRAVVAGAIVAVLTVTAGAAWVSHRVTGRARVAMMGKWVALPLVLAWS